MVEGLSRNDMAARGRLKMPRSSALRRVRGAGRSPVAPRRTVPLNKELRAALVALKGTRNSVEASDRISEREFGMSPGAVQVWFHRLYASLGFASASSLVAQAR